MQSIWVSLFHAARTEASVRTLVSECYPWQRHSLRDEKMMDAQNPATKKRTNEGQHEALLVAVVSAEEYEDQYHGQGSCVRMYLLQADILRFVRAEH